MSWPFSCSWPSHGSVAWRSRSRGGVRASGVRSMARTSGRTGGDRRGGASQPSRRAHRGGRAGVLSARRLHARRDHPGRRRDGLLLAEPVEPGAVGRRHLLDEGALEAPERVRDRLARVREGAVGVRVVRGPHIICMPNGPRTEPSHVHQAFPPCSTTCGPRSRRRAGSRPSHRSRGRFQRSRWSSHE